MKRKSSIKKLFDWEHWSTPMFYVPNLPYAFYLAARAKHSVFFSAANPAIKSAGNGTESKFETIQLVPAKHRPKSVLVLPNTSFEKVLSDIENTQISFPLIAKPDVGFRGLLVEKIDGKKQLESYLKKYPINIIIQEFLDFENECGVFYHRNPNEETGKITSLTLKRFLSVTGNGTSTLRELILNDERASLYISLFEKIHQEKMDAIPANGEIVKLTAVGNHSKGTQFINGNHLISDKLVQTFDELSKNIEGWYYGRVDLKYNAFENLENGSDYKVLEINGIIAEPTHIYDSENYTYFQALKAIRTHWKSLFEIATTNHKDYNVPYKSARKFINEMFELRAYTKKIAKLSKD